MFYCYSSNCNTNTLVDGKQCNKFRKSNGMLKLISANTNDSIETSFGEWNLCQLNRKIRSDDVFFCVVVVVDASVKKFKHWSNNRELFYQDRKSNAIMVSYDSCNSSIKCSLRSNYQLKSVQTLCGA